MTKYLVLRRNGDGRWQEEDTYEASSRNAAIRLHLEGVTFVDGEVVDETYVATPARSWEPQTVSVEKTERLRVGEPRTRAKATPAVESRATTDVETPVDESRAAALA